MDTPTPDPPRTLQIRAALSFLFLGSALFNSLVTLQRPALLQWFAEMASVTLYRTLITQWVFSYATTFIVLLITFEVGVGLLLLGRGRAVRIGLAAAGLFALTLAPVLGLYGLVNLLWVVPALWLVRWEHRVSIPEAIHARFTRSVREHPTPPAPVL